MAELIYYCGTMDSGKSTLALQTAHNHQSRGRTGLIFTSQDRAGKGTISSRLGLKSEAIEVSIELDLIFQSQAYNVHLPYTLKTLYRGSQLPFFRMIPA